MADFIGADGGYLIEDDGEHIRTVVRWRDADGVMRIEEKVASFSTFLIWHERAKQVIEDVLRKRAERQIIDFPAQLCHAADSA